MNLFEVLGTFRVDKATGIADLQAVTTAGQTTATQTEGNFSRMGTSIKSVFAGIGAAMIAAFAVTKITDFAKEAIKAYSDLEAAQAKLFGTMAPVSAEERAAIVADIKAISSEYGIAATQITAAMDSAFDLGVPAEKMHAFMSTAAEFSKVVGVDVEEAAATLAKTTQLMGLDFSETDRVANLLFTGMEQGGIDLGTLATAMGKIGPLANTMGLDMESVVAAVTSLASHGVPAKSALSGIQGALEELSDPTTDVAVAFAQMSGKTFPEFIAGGGTLADAVKIIGDGATATGVNVADLFKSVEAGKAVFALAADGASAYTAKLEEIKTTGVTVATAHDAMANTMQDRMARMAEWWNNIKIDIGGKLVTALEPLMTWLSENTDTITGFITLIVDVIGGVLKVVGPVIGGILDLLNGVLAFLRGDWAAGWEGMKGFLAGIWSAILALFDMTGLTDLFVNGFAAISGAFTTFVTAVGRWGASIVDAIWQGLKGAWHTVTEFFANAWDSLVNALTSWMPGFLKKWLGIGEDSGKQYADGLAASEAEVTGAASDVGDAAVNAVVDAIGQGEQTVADAAEDLGASLTEGLSFGIDQGTPSLLDDLTTLGDTVIDTMGMSFATQSPSKKTAKIGRDVAAGLQVGIAQGTPGIVSEVVSMGQQVRAALDGVLKDLQNTVQNKLKDLLYDVLTGKTSIGDAFTSLMGSIKDTLLKSGIDAAVDWVIAQIGRLISGASTAATTVASVASGVSASAATAAGAGAAAAGTTAGGIGAGVVGTALALAAVPLAIGLGAFNKPIAAANKWITENILGQHYGTGVVHTTKTMASGGIALSEMMARIGDTGVHEAVIPLTQTNLGAIGAGIAASMSGPQLAGAGVGGVQVDMRGMFDGATFYVRNDQDATKIASSIYDLFKTRTRGLTQL